jgi:hypothetical protein
MLINFIDENNKPILNRFSSFNNFSQSYEGIPNIGDKVIIDKKGYRIIDKVFDYYNNTIHIYLEKCYLEIGEN